MKEEIIKKIRLSPENPIEPDESNPFSEDSLGFRDSVIRLQQILQQIETPFTIGIYGGWGSGKTSFMKLLKAHIESTEEVKKRFEFFWFDAWKYENESSLLIPFLFQMSNEFKSFKKAFNSVKKIASAVALTGINAIFKACTLNTIKIKDMTDNLELYEKQIEKAYDSWVSEVNQLKDELQKLVNEITKGGKTLLIFIDDLDRCMPENVVKLMEGIKHFLSVKNSIYMIGVDKMVLQKSIQAKYGSSLISGQEYLEKIVNLSVDIPFGYKSADKSFVLETAKRLAEPSWYEEIEQEIIFFDNSISVLGIDNPRRLRLLTLRYLFFLTLPEWKLYIRDVVIYLIVYKELFPEAYIEKKSNNSVAFFPKDSKDEPYSLNRHNAKDIELCPKAFLDIALDEKYNRLRSFYPPTLWQTKMFDLSDEQIGKTMASPGIRDNEKHHGALEALLQNKYKRANSDYFNLIDFIFSLS